MGEEIINRLYGGAVILFAGIISTAESSILGLGSILFATEGIGDLVTGEHHYFSTSVIDYVDEKFSRFKRLRTI